jgi:hypothetical protein
MITEKIMFFCPIPSFPRGEGENGLLPDGEKKRGAHFYNSIPTGLSGYIFIYFLENNCTINDMNELIVLIMCRQSS